MGANDAQRSTWLLDAANNGMDYRFFHGKGATAVRDDIVLVNCYDEYYDLTSKTKEKLRWALYQGYDYIFLCFPDTYARPERLVTCGFDKCDYLGTTYCHPGGNTYCQGGCGYFLSKRAAEIIVNDPRSYPNEDCFCGDLLKQSGIIPVHCDNFRYAGPGPLKTNKVVSNHLSTQPGGYTVAAMLREHENWKRS